MGGRRIGTSVLSAYHMNGKREGSCGCEVLVWPVSASSTVWCAVMIHTGPT